MVDVSEEVKQFRKTADITEIQMMFGRFATLMDQMDALGIYEELMAKDAEDVSVEYTCNGKYVGPEHVKLFFEDLHAKLNDLGDKRGWFDPTYGVTPRVEVSEEGDRAYASWLMFGPKAKQASPYGASERTLTAFWYGGKMLWELVKVDGVWKILHFHQVTYLSSPYDQGWVKQPECWRESPIWKTLPDEDQRFYVYNPDRVYVKNGVYDWGPYIPEMI